MSTKLFYRDFLFPAPRDSIDSLHIIAYEASITPCGEEIDAVLILGNSSLVRIHSSNDLPLSSFIDKLQNLDSKLERVCDAIDTCKTLVFREWLSSDDFYSTAAVCVNIDEQQTGFVEIGSCVRALRISLDYPADVVAAMRKLRAIIAHFIKELREKFPQFFPETIDTVMDIAE